MSPNTNERCVVICVAITVVCLSVLLRSRRLRCRGIKRLHRPGEAGGKRAPSRGKRALFVVKGLKRFHYYYYYYYHYSYYYIFEQWWPAWGDDEACMRFKISRLRLLTYVLHARLQHLLMSRWKASNAHSAGKVKVNSGRNPICQYVSWKPWMRHRWTIWHLRWISRRETHKTALKTICLVSTTDFLIFCMQFTAPLNRWWTQVLLLSYQTAYVSTILFVVNCLWAANYADNGAETKLLNNWWHFCLETKLRIVVVVVVVVVGRVLTSQRHSMYSDVHIQSCTVHPFQVQLLPILRILGQKIQPTETTTNADRPLFVRQGRSRFGWPKHPDKNQPQN